MLEDYPDADISVSIVWEAMLPSDNEAAARESSKIFNDPRVRQFWDPNKLSGTAYSRDAYPNMRRDLATVTLTGELKDELGWLIKRLKKTAAGPSEAILYVRSGISGWACIVTLRGRQYNFGLNQPTLCYGWTGL